MVYKHYTIIVAILTLSTSDLVVGDTPISTYRYGYILKTFDVWGPNLIVEFDLFLKQVPTGMEVRLLIFRNPTPLNLF